MRIIIDLKTGEHQIVAGEEDENQPSVGGPTLYFLANVFCEALVLANRKAQTYGTAWSDQGYMGNVGRVLSKVSRLKNMMWTDLQRNSSHESVEDTLLDLVNLAAFALHNYRERNKWGDTHV